MVIVLPPCYRKIVMTNQNHGFLKWFCERMPSVGDSQVKDTAVNSSLPHTAMVNDAFTIKNQIAKWSKSIKFTLYRAVV